MNNNVKIRKVHLQTFIDVLADLYNRGVDYVDLIGSLDSDQDSVGISFCKEYMNEKYAENFDNMPNVETKLDISNEDDLNQLI